MDLQSTMNIAALEFAISVLQEKLGEYQKQNNQSLSQTPGRKAFQPSANSSVSAKKRVLSASARARIAQAQKRRWAEKHRQDALAAAPPEAPAEEEPGPAPKKKTRQNKKVKAA